jgi:hypothetical protein
VASQAWQRGPIGTGSAASLKHSVAPAERSITTSSHPDMSASNSMWTSGSEAWIIRQLMWRRAGSFIACLILIPCLLVLAACKPDDSPFKAENDALKKQVARQESLVSSLQDGNKVMQQQIDLLNQEIRDAKKAAESAKGEAKSAAEQLEHQLVQARKLTADIKKTAIEQAAQSIVIVTDRKISNPVSLEVAGFRNQYVIAVQAQPLNVTRLSVKAEFEKLAQGGRILSVSPEETAEIERRLIGEVSKALAAPQKT